MCCLHTSGDLSINYYLLHSHSVLRMKTPGAGAGGHKPGSVAGGFCRVCSN